MAKKTASKGQSASKTGTEKKATTKKTATAKKVTTKKATAKKATAKKATAKKATTKKATAKKAATKQATAKKAAAPSKAAKKAASGKTNGAAKKKAAAVSGPPKTAPRGEDNINVVKDFIAALEGLDFDAALALCAPNVLWINDPFKTAGSREQLDKVLRSMFGDVTLFRVENLEIGQDPDGTVYTDRVDIIEGGGMSMRIRVKGTFVVRNGLITAWTDRFSWPEGARQMAKSLPSIIRFQLGKLGRRRA